jgi:transcriptional regulator with XRE-family HTH domain
MRMKLIEILKACGLSQQDIADRLGIAKSAVSAWANGKHPLPLKHELHLLHLADEVQDAALEDARALDAAAAPRYSLLTGDDWEERKLRTTLQRLWHDYDWQVAEDKDQGLTAALLAALQWFAIYTDAEPMTTAFKPTDIARIETHLKRLQAGLATWRRLNPDSHEEG